MDPSTQGNDSPAMGRSRWLQLQAEGAELQEQIVLHRLLARQNAIRRELAAFLTGPHRQGAQQVPGGLSPRTAQLQAPDRAMAHHQANMQPGPQPRALVQAPANGEATTQPEAHSSLPRDIPRGLPHGLPHTATVSDAIEVSEEVNVGESSARPDEKCVIDLTGDQAERRTTPHAEEVRPQIEVAAEQPLQVDGQSLLGSRINETQTKNEAFQTPKPFVNGREPNREKHAETSFFRPPHDALPTIVRDPDQEGRYVELRCPICKGNSSGQHKTLRNGKLFVGAVGVHSHFRLCHPSEIKEGQTISTGEMVRRSTHKHLTTGEVDAMLQNIKGAYVIESVRGAVSEENSMVRGPRKRKVPVGSDKTSPPPKKRGQKRGVSKKGLAKKHAETAVDESDGSYLDDEDNDMPTKKHTRQRQLLQRQ